MLIFLLISCTLAYSIFYPLYISDEIIISYGLRLFDICKENPELWRLIKLVYLFTYIFSNIVFSNFIYINLFKKIIPKKSKKITNAKFLDAKKENLSLLIGYDENCKENVVVPESGLYQNFLITGTIGSGKTSSAMYPFTNQLIEYNSKAAISEKVPMLILDVKGTFYRQVREYCKKYGLLDDLIVLELDSNIYYNPLHKPSLKPQVLANRLKTILTLFSENNSESYWLDKVEEILAECIKMCRIYNDGYVNFLEIHKLIMAPNYYKEKISILRELFISGNLSHEQIYDLNSSLGFFENEFQTLDQRTLAILKSELTRITNIFVSDYSVSKTFCPNKNQINFMGFKDVIKNGKIVVLNMNISEYRNLSKIIATYLKLDFQTEVMVNLSNSKIKTTAFICDEYDKYLSKTDGEFFSLSREAKCINIISTQSYSSLKNNLKDDASVKVILQNLINKIWFRTDDIFTIEEAQKQLGKEEKERTSKSISENAKQTRFSYITNSLNSENSSISESYNTYLQKDYIYDTNFFTRNLETFSTLTFLSDGTKIYEPKKLKMFPYFKI